MICIGGRSPLRDEDRLPLQSMDQIGLMQPITKFARTILHQDRISEYLAMAYRHAVSGRPGPVFLDIPIDVLYTQVDEERRAGPSNTSPPSEGPPPAPHRSTRHSTRSSVPSDRPSSPAGV